jgi:hypothetical protein
MNCLRCHGLMEHAHVLDLDGGFGEMWARSWRCVNCGHIDDRVVRDNRLAGSAKATARLEIEPLCQEDEIFLGAETYIGGKAA